MKLVLWVLALFAAAIAIVLAAYYNTGTVLFTVPPYKVELAFNTFVIMTLSVFAVFYMLLRILSGLSGMNKKLRHKKAEQMTWSGIRAFFEARYDQAAIFSEKALKLADTKITQVLNAVIGARSAHQQGDYSQRDNLLAIAKEQIPEGKVLTLTTEAELLLDEGRYHDALEVLQSIYSEGGLQSTAVLLLELKAHQMMGNWESVLELTRVLSNRPSVDQASMDELRLQAHLENIRNSKQDVTSLKRYWNTLSWHEKNDGRIAAAAARVLMAQGDNATAQRIIENNLDADVALCPELIALYADCQSGAVSWQIQRAESWLAKHPNDADLLLTLGRLCAYGELWGKAQSYLEASLSIEPGYPAHLALAQLFEKLGKREAASEHYRKGLDFALKQIGSVEFVRE